MDAGEAAAGSRTGAETGMAEIFKDTVLGERYDLPLTQGCLGSSG